jgi:hypothetical protein
MMAAAPPPSGAGSAEAAARAWLERWARETPVGTRVLCVWLFLGWALAQAAGWDAVALSPSALHAGSPFQGLYRLVSAPMCEPSLLSACIMAALVSSSGGALERELGLRRFAAGLAALALLTGACFLALALALGLSAGSSASVASRSTSGLMPTAVAALVVAPPRHAAVMLFIPFRVPPHALPWALIAVAWLLNGVLPLDLVAGVAAGHLFSALLRAQEVLRGAARPALPTTQARAGAPPDSQEADANARGGAPWWWTRLMALAAPAQGAYAAVPTTPLPAGASPAARLADRNVLREAAQARLNKPATPAGAQ